MKLYYIGGTNGAIYLAVEEVLGDGNTYHVFEYANFAEETYKQLTDSEYHEFLGKEAVLVQHKSDAMLMQCTKRTAYSLGLHDYLKFVEDAK